MCRTVSERQKAGHRSVRWAKTEENDANKDLRLPRITHRVTASTSGRRQVPETISHSISKERRLLSVQSPSDKAAPKLQVHPSIRGTKLDL